MSDKKWFSEPFEEGYRAFRLGILDCPFEQNTKKYREWMRGFNNAYFTNLKRRHA